MKKIIVLNHKMNLEYDEVVPYINKLNQIETNNNLIICPSNIYLSDFINYSTWGIGSQNISEYTSGNYTGEVSSLQLKSLGIEYSIIGHYERKKYFHETNISINKKLIECLNSNISPILCFGETGDIDNAIDDLEELLKDIPNIDFIIFAYEPLKVSEYETIEIIQEQIKEIYNYLKDKYNTNPNIIYGGGIDKKDINSLLSINEINGIMIGKLSSNIDKIEKIIKDIK